MRKRQNKDRVRFWKTNRNKVQDGTIIWIYNNIEAHGKGLLTDLELNRDLYVRIRAKQRTLDDYRELKNKIQDFFNFFIDSDVLTESFKGLFRLDNHGHKDMKEITVLYHSTISKKMRKTKIIRPFLFRYDEISELFVSLVQRWFKLREKENVVLDNYFGVMYNPGLFTENILLMLAEALEAYHTDYRKKLSESAQTRRERTRRIMPIVNELSISEEDKNWISGTISNRSFPSFEERIEEVYDDHREIATKFLHTKDKGTFGSKINRYRNGISHANKNFQKESEELFRSTIDLQILVQLCVLSLLEFPYELIRKKFLNKND
jgi:hypothetical protein